MATTHLGIILEQWQAPTGTNKAGSFWCKNVTKLIKKYKGITQVQIQDDSTVFGKISG
jgi:hypothetical protein